MDRFFDRFVEYLDVGGQNMLARSNRIQTGGSLRRRRFFGILVFFDTLTLMKRVPITPENETTTPVGRVSAA
uniref:Uncharacterized protein n=1 Tax=Candidatus Kentrum sp. LPFa TaxID=2126335 RepID=A0A450W209_9GAMM|nr:MAG: hypothetical protein BECKLPF1236B_GA0070989_101923 [Candidatus Kentron sp. LPFa]